MKTFDIKKQLRELQKWFSGPCELRMWTEPRADLIQFVKFPSAAEFGKAMGRIRSCGAFHARKGSVLIGAGDASSGWQELAKFFDYKLWVLRTEVERERILAGRGNRAADPTQMPFHLLGMALTFQRWSDAAWIGETVLETRKSLHWFGGPLAHHLVKLCALSSGLDLPDPKQGPYADVFANWSETDKQPDIIRQICDCHVEQIKSQGDFEGNPHDIFPSEILALYRVREKLGLETPWVNHPLLDTPFTQVPEKITYEPDPLVLQAMDLVTKLLPEAVAKR